MIYEAVVVDLPWYVIPSSEILQEIFIWNLFIKHSHNDKVGWRDLHAAHRTVILRRPADDPPMIVRCVFHRGIPVRESADFRTEARRTPPDLMAIFRYNRLGHRAMSVRTSYDVHPMPRIPYSSSPMPSRCADIGNIGRDIVRPPVDLWPWHYDPRCPWHWAPFPIGFLEIRKVYTPQRFVVFPRNRSEKSQNYMKNHHGITRTCIFKAPDFFPYESQINDFPTGTFFFKEFNDSPFRWTPKF